MLKLADIGNNLIKVSSSPDPEFKCAVTEPGINCPGMSQIVIFKVTCLMLTIPMCVLRLHFYFLGSGIHCYLWCSSNFPQQNTAY